MASFSSSNRTDFANHPGVRKTQSGKWGAAILDPITKRSVWLGSYSTPKEAAEAYTSKKIEYQSISTHKRVTSSPKARSNHRKFRGVRSTSSGKWGASIRHPVTKANVWLGSYETPEEAADAYNKKKVEFDLLKTPPSRITLGTCDTDESGEGLKRKRGEFGSMVSAREKLRRLNDEVGNEGLVFGGIDGYGRLIGEFSRLDDELWLTTSLDEDGDIESRV